jgi:hypothetical protein
MVSISNAVMRPKTGDMEAKNPGATHIHACAADCIRMVKDRQKVPMEFAFYFLRVFVTDLLYAAPLLISFGASINLIGFIIGRIEGWSGSDALYHAFINATIAGYGDFRSTRRSSKLLAVSPVFVGLVFTSMVVAIALHAADYAYGKVYDRSGYRGRSGD